MFCIIFVCHVYNSFQNVRQIGEIILCVNKWILLPHSSHANHLPHSYCSLRVIVSYRASKDFCRRKQRILRKTYISTEIFHIFFFISLSGSLLFVFLFLTVLYTKSLRTWDNLRRYQLLAYPAKPIVTSLIGFSAHPILICIWNKTYKPNQIELAQYWGKFVDGRVTNFSSCSLYISSSPPRNEHTLACELCDVVKRAQNQIA